MRNAYICDGIRTPFGKYAGALASVRPDDLAAITLRSLLSRNTRLAPAEIDEVVLGCANQAGEDNRNVARMALLLGGVPETVPGVTVNRLCASGLEAIGYAARSVLSGQADLVLAGGTESMTRAPFVMPKAGAPYSRDGKIEDTTIGWRLINPQMRKAFGVDSMPETADNVARQFDIKRLDQDAFACRSQQRAAQANQRGFFKDEIIPVDVKIGKGEAVVVAWDEHVRPETTMESLASLKPINGPDKTVTAGNASGVNDGAAALVIASDEAVRRYDLTPKARIVDYVTAGVEPRIMGVGPVPATQKLMARNGYSISSFDVIELNEAFAAQALAVLRQLNVPDDSAVVNANGGAIALGHPLGASGARLVITAARRLEAERKERALITLCVGVGQGAAMAIERV